MGNKKRILALGIAALLQQHQQGVQQFLQRQQKRLQ